MALAASAARHLAVLRATFEAEPIHWIGSLDIHPRHAPGMAAGDIRARQSPRLPARDFRARHAPGMAAPTFMLGLPPAVLRVKVPNVHGDTRVRVRGTKAGAWLARVCNGATRLRLHPPA